MRRYLAIVLYLALVTTGLATTVLFSSKISLNVVESDVTVYPSYISVNVSRGVEYVKSVKVSNYGGEKCVYFTEVVEGPSPNEIDVFYRRTNGTSINYYNKLCLGSGNANNPYNVTVNVHVRVNSTAQTGWYNIYLMLKSSS
ncbi:MAG: hypothetical protein NZ895_04535 [Archaeoglobaceae archaeon]|nr:hypothetical protein [Archaeoglobaceae archaeon]MDW8014112.1 hypothetical protein [Archaeoglobaceae archaeon]